MNITYLNENEIEEICGGLTLVTGINSGHLNFIEAPTAAIPGALNAFSHVIENTAFKGGLSNVGVIF